MAQPLAEEQSQSVAQLPRAQSVAHLKGPQPQAAQLEGQHQQGAQPPDRSIYPNLL